MSVRVVRSLLLLALLAYGAAAAASCGDDASTPSTGRTPAAPPPSAADFPSTTAHQHGVRLPSGLVTRDIGRDCVACHADVVKAYTTSAMHAALTLPGGQESVEARFVGTTFRDPVTGRTIRFDVRDGRYVQTAVYVDPQGVERARYEMPFDLVVGSGHATRSYFQVRDGRFLELPLTWYRGLDGLGISPGEGFHGELMRNATRTCVACHTGEIDPVDPDADLGFQGTVSLGIGCDRCHGDGTEHAQTGDPASIVNPSKLPEDRQADLCFQCHLSSGLSVERPGRTIADYRPGQNLADWMGVMNSARKRDEGSADIAGHAERMKASVCYTASHATSDNPMTCTTCHNPHRGHLSGSAAREADRGCLVCHQQDACHEEEVTREGKLCFSCHMPEIPSRDIAHTRITDHKIVRVPPEPKEPDPPVHAGLLALDNPPLVNSLDPDDTHPLRHLLDARAYLFGAEVSFVLAGQKAEGWIGRTFDALAAHAAQKPDAEGLDDDVDALRGRALALSEQHEQAIPFLERARDARPDLPRRHAELGYSLAALGRIGEAVDSLKESIRIDPYQSTTWYTLADVLKWAGRPAEGLDELERARPYIGPSLRNAILARDLAAKVGQPERALRHAYDVLLFQPLDVESLWRTGRVAEQVDTTPDRSRALFEQALAQDGNFVPAMISLGHQFADSDPKRAREYAQRALRLAPNLPQAQELMRKLDE